MNPADSAAIGGLFQPRYCVHPQVAGHVGAAIARTSARWASLSWCFFWFATGLASS